MSVEATTWVWKHSKAEGTDLLVLLALADFAQEDHRCFGSWGKLEQKTKLSRRTISRCLTRLQAAGELIMRERGKRRVAGTGNQATIWVIPVPDEMGVNLTPVSTGHLSGVSVTPKWCHRDTPTEENISKRRDSEPPPVASLPPASSNPSLPKKRREKNPHPVLRPDLGDEAWLAHVKTLPQYAHINFDALLERCVAWCASKGEGAPTRRRLMVWADKEQKPLTISSKRRDDAAERRRLKMIEEEREMRAAFAAAQQEAA